METSHAGSGEGGKNGRQGTAVPLSGQRRLVTTAVAQTACVIVVAAATENQDDQDDNPQARVVTKTTRISTHVFPPPILCSLYLM